MTPLRKRQLAVCSWSGRPDTPRTMIARLQTLGIDRIQLALDPLLLQPAWGEVANQLRDAGVTVVSAMFETRREDYSSPAAIRRSSGLLPSTAYIETLLRVPAYIELMGQLAIDRVSFHAGFMPADVADPRHALLLQRLGAMADAFAADGKQLLLETGQETAVTLAHTLRSLDKPNLKVNFDPGNLLLYNMGDPIQALQGLLPWIAQIHVKDAIASGDPEIWGQEKSAGEGEVDWARFFEVLARADYGGDLVIECESLDDPFEGIRRSLAFLERHLA